MKKSLLLFALCVAVAVTSTLAATDDPQAPIDMSIHAPPIVVACVGDSITAHGNPHGYPAQLGNMLGDQWTVENFGSSGISVGFSYRDWRRGGGGASSFCKSPIQTFCGFLRKEDAVGEGGGGVL